MKKTKFDANQLLDTVRSLVLAKNDADLARRLEVAPPVLSKIRHRRLPVGAMMLIRMHEESGLSIKDMRGLMGDTEGLFRCGRAG